MDFRITIASPPDREQLVAEVFFGNEQVAEINQDAEDLRIEVYCRPSAAPWVLPFEEFMNTLNQAKVRLLGNSAVDDS